MDFLVLLGPPGAGKGTVSRLLASQAGFSPLSTGETIRREMADPLSDFGRRARPFMDRGDYLPDAMALELFSSILDPFPPGAKIAFDGFPRTVPQAESFLAWAKAGGHRYVGCVSLAVDEDTAKARLRDRRVCTRCRAPYHLRLRPPRDPDLCDLCGGSLIPREDDDPERLGQRMRQFRERTAPLLVWLRGQGPCLDVEGDADPQALAGQVGAWINTLFLD